VFLGKPGCFIAGADIVMLQKCKSTQEACNLSKGAKHYATAFPSSTLLNLCLFDSSSLPRHADGN